MPPSGIQLCYFFSEPDVLSFVITGTGETIYTQSCSMLLSIHGRQGDIIAEAKAWKVGDLGLWLALSLWASISIAINWESWTDKLGTPSCSETLWIHKPAIPGAPVATRSWDCQTLTLWSIPFIVLKEGLGGHQWRGPEEHETIRFSVSPPELAPEEAQAWQNHRIFFPLGSLGKALSTMEGVSCYSWLASGNSQEEEVTWPGLLLAQDVLCHRWLGKEEDCPTPLLRLPMIGGPQSCQHIICNDPCKGFYKAGLIFYSSWLSVLSEVLG